MNKIVSLSNNEPSRPSSSQVFPATPAQSQGIEEAHQAANQLEDTARMKYYEAFNKITIRYDAYRTEFDTAPTSALLKKLPKSGELDVFNTRYFEFRPQTEPTTADRVHRLAIMSMGHKPEGHWDGGQWVNHVTVPFKVTLSQPIPRLEAITGIVRSRRLFGGFDYRIDLSKVSCTVSENGLTVGDQTIPLVMINKVRLGWKAMGGDQWTRDNSQASSQELMTSVIAMMDQSRRAEEVLQKSQLSKDLNKIQADLVKTLTQIGLHFIDPRMSSCFQEALDGAHRASSFEQFQGYINASRDQFANEMTAALTPQSAPASDTHLRHQSLSLFNACLEKVLQSNDLPAKFPNVTMIYAFAVKVGQPVWEPFVRDDQSTQRPEDDPKGHSWQPMGPGPVPADQKEFYRLLGLR